MCHGYWMRWIEQREDEEPVTYVSDPEEPAEPIAEEEPHEPDREVVLTGAQE